jgi:hypothetical protein
MPGMCLLLILRVVEGLATHNFLSNTIEVVNKHHYSVTVLRRINVMADSVILKEKDTQDQIVDPIEVRERARHMLGLGQMKAARELVQQALQQHPTHEGLLHMWDVIRPGEVKRIDKRYGNLKSEMEWIKNNRGKYPGKWVALVGDEAIGIEDNLKTLFEKVQERKSKDDTPLFHRMT